MINEIRHRFLVQSIGGFENQELNQKGGMSSERGSEEAVGSSRVIKSVFFALLLDLLGFTLILPLLPSILDHYGQTEDSVYQSLQSIVDWFREAVGVPMETKYNSVLFGGLIGSLFSLLQFLSSPLTGAASDHYGRKPLLILTTLGMMSSYAVWAVSRSFSMFLLSRVIGGICKGNVSLCTAMIADLPCPKARNKGMMMVGIAFSLGFTVGPLMGAYFAINSSKEEVFYHGPAVLALVFSAADLLFIIVMLPETLPKQNKNLKVLGFVYFTYLFLFSGLEFTLSFLTHQRFQFTSMQQGKMFFFMGITMALIQGGYARRIKPGHHIRTVRLAIVLLIPAFALIGLAWNLKMVYIGLILYSFGSANQKGTVMGILRSLGALARALGPIVASSVYWIAGAETCFIISSASFIIPLALLRRVGGLKQE
ncbi:unnamed protein product [Coregonus sp. 'balchen']|nr:unnamed protein product [Coregonus sp. 'balchen']